ncbi:hydrolase [Paenibacillus albicereus]|uniref:Hydrolase n=1 Tax=Paenibacillus albicereus TaxID=2726185 RepID=A0A6H2GX14_9BACL|nr:hydrolase [Paenibacillus albicereus]QJC51971.1 hydrolase [Paenibacillus albicereus]
MARRSLGRSALALGAAGTVLVAAWWLAAGTDDGRRPLLEGGIRSGNLSTDYGIEQALDDARRLELNAVNVPVVVNVADPRASRFELDEASLDKARRIIPLLHGQGIRVLLEPYPWIADGSVAETAWDPSDPSAFFRRWQKDVLEPLVREVADPLDVEAVVAASNLVHLEPWSGEWVRLLKDLKTKYGGLVTYKTNAWHTAEWDEASRAAFRAKLDNPLWAEVDFISVAAYFELTDKPSPSAAELADAIRQTERHGRGQNVPAELEQLSRRWNKPYFFGELGFPAWEGAAAEPWNPAPSDKQDGQLQARLFAAYRDAFRGQASFLGYSVFAIGETGPDKRYYPSEESVAVIRSW